MLTVKVEGLDELQRKLGPAGVVPKPVTALFHKAKNKASKEAKARARGRAGTGALGNAIKGSVLKLRMGGIRIPDGVRVAAFAAVAMEVEEGRKPGSAPGYRSLQRWMKRAGMDASPKSVKLLRQAIKQSGTQGLRYMEGAGEELLDALPGYVREAEAAVRAEWNK